MKTSINRNTPCPCLSGRRYKDCCGNIPLQAKLLKGDNPFRLNNDGCLCRSKGKHRLAQLYFQKALAIKPDIWAAHSNLAGNLQREGRMAESIEHYLTVCRLQPDFRQAQKDFGYASLLSGNLERGWDLISATDDECRIISKSNLTAPWWHGEDLSDKTLLVWGDQGIGDEIRYCGLLPDVKANRVIYVTEKRLIPLVERSMPSIETVSEPQECDYQTILTNVCKYTRPTFESFPKRAGYLKPNPEKQAYWRQQLNALPGYKVGISWCSGMMEGDRWQIHTQLKEWSPILKTKDATFINLQYGDNDLELVEVADKLGIKIIIPKFDLKNDLDELAALASQLNLIIATGSALIELTSAIGKETWMMTQQFYNWDCMGQDYNPWHPVSMKIYFKQVETPFTGVIKTVANDLNERINHVKETQRQRQEAALQVAHA